MVTFAAQILWSAPTTTEARVKRLFVCMVCLRCLGAGMPTSWKEKRRDKRNQRGLFETCWHAHSAAADCPECLSASACFTTYRSSGNLSHDCPCAFQALCMDVHDVAYQAPCHFRMRSTLGHLLSIVQTLSLSPRLVHCPALLQVKGSQLLRHRELLPLKCLGSSKPTVWLPHKTCSLLAISPHQHHEYEFQKPYGTGVILFKRGEDKRIEEPVIP
eukprot:scaffold30711_cov19-Tisochrysis_lutea.AAC.1